MRLTFAASVDTERRLRAIIAAEARCCAFLHMELRAGDGGLIAGAGTVGIVIGVVVLAAGVYAVTRRRKAGSKC